MADDYIRQAIWKVDTFHVWDGTSAVRPFMIRDGNVYVGGDLIARGTIAGDRLIAGSITTRELAAGSVKANHIAAGAIGTEHLQAGSVFADLLAAGAVSDFINVGSAVNDMLPRSGSEVMVVRGNVTPVAGGTIIAWFNTKIVYDHPTPDTPGDLSKFRQVEIFFRFVRIRTDTGKSAEIKTLRVPAPPYGCFPLINFIDTKPPAAPCRYEVRASAEAHYAPADRGDCRLNHTQMILASIKR